MISRKLIQKSFTIVLLIMCLVIGSPISVLCEGIGDYLPEIQEFLIHSPRLCTILTDEDKELFSIAYWSQDGNDKWYVIVIYAGIYNASIGLFVDRDGHVSFVDQYYQDYFLYDIIRSVARSPISRSEAENMAEEAFFQYVNEQQGTAWLNSLLERHDMGIITEDDIFIMPFYFGSSNSAEGVWDCIICPSRSNEGKNFFCDEISQWVIFRIDAYSLETTFTPVND